MTNAIAPKNQNEARQLDRMKAGMHRLNTHLVGKQDFLQKAAGEHLSSDRMIRLVLASASSNPLLLECTPESIMVCLMDCARLGLEPSGRGGMWLIPFKRNLKDARGNWSGEFIYEAQAITDYRAELTLARRSGHLRELSAHCVYEKERFELTYGDEERLLHVPELFGEKGKLRGVYAVARLKDGYQRAFMNLQEVQARRERSRASRSGPWVTDFEKMALKTVIREVLNLCPMSSEYREYVEKEEARELVGREPAQPVVDVEPLTPRDVVEEPPQAPAARPRSAKAQAMKEALRSQPEAEEEPPPPEEPEASPEAPDDDFAVPPEPDDAPGMNEVRGALFKAQAELAETFGGNAERAKRLWARYLPLDINDIPSVQAGQARLKKAQMCLKRARLAVDIEGVTADLFELSVNTPEIPDGFEREWTIKRLEAALDERLRHRDEAQKGGS